jgi:hypothetical protein
MLFIIVFASLTAPVAAVNVTNYHFEAASGGARNEITVSIPQDYMIFTLDSSPDDPNFTNIGLDTATFKDYLRQNNIILDAISPDLETEIFIIMKSTKDSVTVGNYNHFTDKELMEYQSDIQKGMESQGFSVFGYQVFTFGLQKYLNMSALISSNGTTSYCEMYATTVNKYQIGFYFKNYSHEVTSAQKETLRQIVASAEYYPIDTFSPAKSSNFTDSLLSNILKYAIIGGALAAVSAIVAAIKKKKASAGTSPAVNWPPVTTVPVQNSSAATDDRPVNIMTCPTCGAINQNDRLVCYRCGRPLRPESGNETTAADESEQRWPPDSAGRA